MKLFRKYMPLWAEKRMKELYRECINDVVRCRKDVNIEVMLNGKMVLDKKTVEKLRKYSFAVGEVAALEVMMDRLFIEYNDNGKIKELYL